MLRTPTGGVRVLYFLGVEKKKDSLFLGLVSLIFLSENGEQKRKRPVSLVVGL